MITHVPGPMDHLIIRLGRRWDMWVDGLFADPPPPPDPGPQVVQKVEPVAHGPRGLPAVIAMALLEGRAIGSQREIARRFNTSKSTVQRAHVLVREMAPA